MQELELELELERKWLENHEIYYIGAAELPLRCPRCTPLLGWRYLYSAPSMFNRGCLLAFKKFSYFSLYLAKHNIKELWDCQNN